MALPGVFCLEGEWDRDLRQRLSVEPVLELLERLRLARYIHRDVATVSEFEYYLKKWGQKGYHEFEVLYLAMHGDMGTLHLGKDSLTLNDLDGLIQGKAANRVIYFASCSTMLEDEEALKSFVKSTGARAAIGYWLDIDWLDSVGFEVFLLERLLRQNRTDAFFRGITREHPELVPKLGLTVATKRYVYY
jgi:hypothetical protein